jgi:hypothetical protein
VRRSPFLDDCGSWRAGTKKSGFGGLDVIGSTVELATKSSDFELPESAGPKMELRSSGFASPVAPGSVVELKNPENLVTVVQSDGR